VGLEVGAYTLRVKAHDTEGLSAESSVAITVAAVVIPPEPEPAAVGTGGVSGGAWPVMKNAAGVIRYCDLQSASSSDAALPPAGGGTSALYNSRFLGPEPLHSPWSKGVSSLGTTGLSPTIDTSFKPPGMRGSMLFLIPPFTGANPSGDWMMNFTQDRTTGGYIKEGEEFFLQFCMAQNSAHATTIYQSAGAGGTSPKIFDVVPGDVKDTSWTGSSDTGKLVVNRYFGHNIEKVYRYFFNPGFSDQDIVGSIPGESGDASIDLQPNGDAIYCRYTDIRALENVGNFSGVPNGCYSSTETDVFGTRRLHVQVGPGSVQTASNGTQFGANVCRVRYYIKPSGNTSVPVLITDATVYLLVNGNFGKMTFFPYITDKDPTQNHALGKLWVSKLLVTRKEPAWPIDPPGWQLTGINA
jgi:hypothetical protein